MRLDEMLRGLDFLVLPPEADVRIIGPSAEVKRVFDAPRRPFGLETDGEPLEPDDLVLLTAQDDSNENGVWIAREGAWQRA